MNGGVRSADEVQHHLTQVDGVMLGRAVYQQPFWLAELDRLLFGTPETTRELVVQAMVSYAHRETAHREPLRAISRHMLGLYHGQHHARVWRQLLSDPVRLDANDATLLLEAMEAATAAPTARAA